jgi:oligopeptide/dipeptide ABC transporter ATP-binding protein
MSLEQRQTDVLQVQRLQVQFKTRDGLVYAVQDLSFQAAPGEIVGLVGESGCGKSTAALALMRLVPKPGRIVGGSILLNSRDILTLSEAEMRSLRGREVAMVFQDALTALDPRMTVGRQIMEPLRIHLKLTPKAARERAAELLAQVGIPSPASRLNQFPHEFSGGMRQRVMIALALSCSPSLLIADEPTTALDVTTQNQILNLLVKLKDETGAAIVLITHDVGVVSNVCDRVVVMYAGREVEVGGTHAIFTGARHPYSRGLLESTLMLDGDRTRPLEAIPGLPPELIDLPPGCVFYPRCKYRSEQCKTAAPRLEPVAPAHEAACWNWRSIDA